VPRPTVLVVDPSDETLEVLRTALAHQGAEILSARRAEQGLDMALRHRPAVIVLDEDSESCWSGQLAAQFDDAARRNSASLLVLGAARRRHRLPMGEFMAKPYHYAPLIRRIELLLAQAQQAFARSA
jgi:DNA-binding response OmpR family regulator